MARPEELARSIRRIVGQISGKTSEGSGQRSGVGPAGLRTCRDGRRQAVWRRGDTAAPTCLSRTGSAPLGRIRKSGNPLPSGGSVQAAVHHGRKGEHVQGVTTRGGPGHLRRMGGQVAESAEEALHEGRDLGLLWALPLGGQDTQTAASAKSSSVSPLSRVIASLVSCDDEYPVATNAPRSRSEPGRRRDIGSRCELPTDQNPFVEATGSPGDRRYPRSASRRSGTSSAGT
jgi:hypothetical protein